MSLWNMRTRRLLRERAQQARAAREYDEERDDGGASTVREYARRACEITINRDVARDSVRPESDGRDSDVNRDRGQTT